MTQSKLGRPISGSTPPERRRVNGYNREYYEKNRDAILARKREKMREYRAADPEKHARQSREAKARQKEKLFDMYGHACAVCGFADKRALTLDHVNQNGNEERRRLGERGVYRRALAKYRPDEYRTLCMNCQFIERHKNGNEN